MWLFTCREIKIAKPDGHQTEQLRGSLFAANLRRPSLSWPRDPTS